MTKKKTEGRFAYEGLDRVLHERARLGVVTSLITHPAGLSFAELKQMCALTDGNLARHLKALEDDGVVKTTKREERGRTQTFARVTAAGRKRFLRYLGVLEQVVRDAAVVARADAKGPALRRSPILGT